MQDTIYTLKILAITALVPIAITMANHAGLCLHC
jgi:hypothetical protein